MQHVTNYPMGLHGMSQVGDSILLLIAVCTATDYCLHSF